MSHSSHTCIVDLLQFLLKNPFEEFEEIYDKICKESKTQYNDEK